MCIWRCVRKRYSINRPNCPIHSLLHFYWLSQASTDFVGIYFIGTYIDTYFLINKDILPEIILSGVYFVTAYFLIGRIIGSITKFLSPDIAIGTRLHKIALLAFSCDFANKTKTKHKTTISVHELFLSDSTFNYSIILLFDVRFSNNFIFLFYRYYYFNVYFFNVCLHINRI